MKVDLSKTTTTTSPLKSFGKGLKSTGQKMGEQIKHEVRSEGIQTDGDTKRVLMTAETVATPIAQQVVAETVVKNKMSRLSDSINSQAQTFGENYFSHYKKTASIYDIELQSDHFKQDYATMNAGHNGTKGSFDISEYAKANGRSAEEIRRKIESGQFNDRITKITLDSAGNAKITGSIYGAKDISQAIEKTSSAMKLKGNNPFETAKLQIFGNGKANASYAEYLGCNKNSKLTFRESYNLEKRAEFMIARFSANRSTSGNGLEAVDKVKIKAAERNLAKAAGRYENLAKKYEKMTSSRGFRRSAFRLMTNGLRQSDAGQGARLLEPILRMRKVPVKFACGALNVGASITRAVVVNAKVAKRSFYVLKDGGSLRKFFTTFSNQKELLPKDKFFGGNKDKLTKFLSKRIRETRQNWAKAFLEKHFGKGSQAVKLFDSLIRENTQGFGLGVTKSMQKDAVQKIRADLRREILSHTRFGRATNRVIDKVSSIINAPRRLRAAVRKKIRNKLANTAIGRIVKGAKKALKTVADTLAKIFKVLAKWIVILAILFTFALAILCTLAEMEDYYKSRLNFFTTSSSQKQTNKLGKAIIEDWCHDLHEKQLEEIDAIAAQGNVANINYPNGTKENYKEIYTMLQVMTNNELYEYYQDDKDALEYATGGLYTKTHKLTYSSYSSTDEVDTAGSAYNINLTVIRDDMACYEIWEDWAGVAATGGEGETAIQVPDITGECADSSWSTAYSTVKTMIAQSGATYDQEAWQTLVITDANGTYEMKVRQDCSGYVYACMRAYQHAMGLPMHDSSGSSYSLCADTENAGFIKIPFNVNNLQVGDIITKGGEHAEIFAGSENGVVYAYSNGATDDMRVAGATRSVNIAGYDWIWRCTGVLGNNNTIGNASSGGATGSSGTGVTASAAANIIDSTGSHLNDISLNPSSFDEFIEYSDNNMFILGATNMGNVVFNEDTGNEDGYETTILATINTAKQNGWFTNATYTNETKTYKTQDDSSDDEGAEIDYVRLVNHDPETNGKSNSADYIRYLMAKHGVQFPIYANDISLMSLMQSYEGGSAPVKEVTTLSNLQVGDIVWYLPAGEDASKDITYTQIRNYSASNQLLQAVMEKCAVPLMYIGDGQFTAFCKDITATSVDAYNASYAEIRTFSRSDLVRQRIIKMYRYTGWTKSAVYGSTNMFSGWTDANISTVLEAQYSDCWKESTDYTFTDDDGNSITYKAFYSEDKDMFAADVVSTTEHDEEFKTEMLTLGLKYYDTYGILPSILYSHAAAASDYRTTEESIKGFNVFEKIDNGEAGLEVQKWSYDSDGNPTVVRKKYKVYENIESAVLDFYADSEGKTGGFPSATTGVLAYNEQFANYKAASGSTRTVLSQIRSDDASTMNQWDNLAVDLKKRQDEVTTAYKASNGLNYNEACTESEHESLQSAYDTLKSKLDYLNKWYDENQTTLFGGYKSDTAKTLIANASSRLETMKSALEKQQAYLDAQKTTQALTAKQQALCQFVDANKEAIKAAQKAAYGNAYTKSDKVTQAQYNAYADAVTDLWLTKENIKEFATENPSYAPSGGYSYKQLEKDIKKYKEELEKIRSANKLKNMGYHAG